MRPHSTAPPSVLVDDDEERKDPDDAVPFAPSSEKEVSEATARSLVIIIRYGDLLGRQWMYFCH